MKDYIPYAVNVDMENVRMRQLPVTPKTLNGISFVVHDKTATEALINEMFNLNQEDNDNT